MNFRTTRAMDFVSASKNMTENARKTKALQIKWINQYEWLCVKYRELEKMSDELCRERLTEQTEGEITNDDTRSCLPFPKTDGQNYGWLANKPEFRLERYGSFRVRYRHPMKDITLLGGNISSLAVGTGFF